MTDLSPKGTADDGHNHDSLPRFSTAEDVNPPQLGDHGYNDYVKRRSTWLHGIEREAAQSPGIEVRPIPYFNAGLGRMVSADDPVPETEEPRPTDGKGSEPPTRQVVAGAPADDIRRRTDASNGEYFAQLYGHRVRCDH